MTLDEAEEAMLSVVCERVQMQGVQSLLDLGCGWGSTGLYIAKRYPGVKVTCVSNSNSQRAFIQNKAKALGLHNVIAVTMDANVMDFPAATFDRVVTVEMFEHMKNYEVLLGRVQRWLKPGGALFVHIFTHRTYSYHFQEGWMADNFFTGGTMPSQLLLAQFQTHELHLEERWTINGNHYSKTLEAWLQRIDANKTAVMDIMAKVYGTAEAQRRYSDWRLFNLACSELFKFNGGNEWFVSHYRFAKSA